MNSFSQSTGLRIDFIVNPFLMNIDSKYDLLTVNIYFVHEVECDKHAQSAHSLQIQLNHFWTNKISSIV